MNTVFYLVRHGESEGNANRDIVGGDDPLTAKGKQQAREAAKRFQDVVFDQIFSSDLQRAVETAEIIAATKNLPVQQLPLLRERSFGELEELPSAEMIQRFQAVFDAFPTQTPEEQWRGKLVESMESPREAVDRLVTFLEEASKKHVGKTILVVNHGALMRMFLVHLGLGSFMEYPAGSVSNTGHIKLIQTENGFKVSEMVMITKTDIPAARE